MKPNLIFTLILGCWIGFSPMLGAFAKTDAEIEEMIQEALMERHPQDTPDWWRGLGPRAPQVIIGLYEHSTHTYQRLRLLQGLGWFDSPEVSDFLKRQAEHAADDVIRTTAIRSVGYSQGVKEADFIAKFLENSDPQMRYAAAETLRQMKDVRALELVEQYLKREKLAWISQKLKGVMPRPSGTLTPVATSEDRLSLEFQGEWQGYWITPRLPMEKGLNSVPIFGVIQMEGTNELRATFQLKNKMRTQRWKWDRISGKGSQISGVLISSSEPGSITEVSFEGSLIRQAGSLLLELRAKNVGGFLILRRNPS